ncbi:hypothetical protein [Zhihengliuella salsuginis]|uniref:Uncharacterized protein n=1 Tax=Zhihengliuella salsuginis TaxID=578222 RepID=A0ABQ3GKP9_9MICC|nr:hypothetical protein [Zhihengliuella salsuginis]GHD12966.1 hypothetical protein GCM10008096_28770 [Zhihengliuella salsuginis]
MLETLLWVLVPILVLTLGFWWVSSLRKRNARQVASAVSPESARAAAERLTPEQHRSVYRNLAAGNFLGAVQEYRNATGTRSVKECIVAVRSLETHPQVAGDSGARPAVSSPSAPEAAAPAPEPEAGADDPAAGGQGPDGDGAGELPDNFVVPDDWTEKFGGDAGRTVATYKITEQVDGEAHEFSTADLPPAEADQFQSLMRDANFSGAADLLASYSGLTREKIQPLLEAAPDASNGTIEDGFSDFGFEGEGPDGRISFNSAHLPGEQRSAFLQHLAEGRLEEAGRIVADFTGLSEAAIRQVLSSFNDGR